MKRHARPEELLDFPCDHLFKAFGPNDGTERFVQGVRAAVDPVIPVGADAIKVRPSSKGGYLCVSVAVRLLNFDQLAQIYANLREVEGVKYLL